MKQSSAGVLSNAVHISHLKTAAPHEGLLLAKAASGALVCTRVFMCASSSKQHHLDDYNPPCVPGTRYTFFWLRKRPIRYIQQRYTRRSNISGTTATVALQAAVDFVTATRSLCSCMRAVCSAGSNNDYLSLQCNSMHTVSPRILGRLIPGGVHCSLASVCISRSPSTPPWNHIGSMPKGNLAYLGQMTDPHLMVKIFQGTSVWSSSCYRAGTVRSATFPVSRDGSVISMYKSCQTFIDDRDRIYSRLSSWPIWSIDDLDRDLSGVWNLVLYFEVCSTTWQGMRWYCLIHTFHLSYQHRQI